MKLSRWLMVMCVGLLLGAVGTAAAQDRLRIGALIKNLDNEYFLTMQQGYEFAAARYGIDIVVGSTPNENSEAEQLALLEGWLNEGGFDGFIVTPFRATSLNSGLQQATAAGIPIINIDELIPADALEGITLAAQIASNNVRGGQTAANWVIANVAAGSEVAVIEGAPGTSSSIDRVSGFTDTVLAAGYNVVASQTANWDRAEAFNVATNILQGNPNVQAIFAANDGMGLGALEAVEAAGLSEQVKVLSVDAIPEAVASVAAGGLAGTVAQYPDEMAVLAVEAMRKVIAGRPIAPFIESPVVLITAENAATAGSRLPADPAMPALRIGAVTKNLDNEFFLTMIAGYERAAADMGIEIVTGSTPNENSEAEQLAILEGWLNEGNFNGFAVTPFRATSLNSGLQQATTAGLPIVNLDELIPADAREGINLAAQVASDNVRAGQNAGNWVIANVEAGSDVAVIEGAPGTSSSIDRVSGFTDAVSAAGYNVVASQTANWDRAEAFNVATNILQGNPNVRAIFAANDGMGLGAVEAVEAAGLTGQVVVLSVDAIPEAIEAVRAGRLAGTVAQYPDEMAYLAIEALVKVIEGRPVAPFIESPVVLITADNLPG
jgi:ABC-type sugar transport system substrate-binding protein